jgi:hypothetical protein
VLVNAPELPFHHTPLLIIISLAALQFGKFRLVDVMDLQTLHGCAPRYHVTEVAIRDNSVAEPERPHDVQASDLGWNLETTVVEVQRGERVAAANLGGQEERFRVVGVGNAELQETTGPVELEEHLAEPAVVEGGRVDAHAGEGGVVERDEPVHCTGGGGLGSRRRRGFHPLPFWHPALLRHRRRGMRDQ